MDRDICARIIDSCFDSIETELSEAMSSDMEYDFWPLSLNSSELNTGINQGQEAPTTVNYTRLPDFPEGSNFTVSDHPNRQLMIETNQPKSVLADLPRVTSNIPFDFDQWIAHKLNIITMREKNKPESANPKYDASRTCKCRNSRCIKLYCECFLSGMYCGESCKCVQCYNNLDYEDTVQIARERVAIEAKSKVNKEKSCTCKKSKCNKQYCECFQAKVGCSKECQCDGCENSFGVCKDFYVRVTDQSDGEITERRQKLSSRNNATSSNSN